MNTYNNYQKAMDEWRRAESARSGTKQRTGLDAMTGENDPAWNQRNKAANDQADNEVAQAREKLNQLKSNWENSGYQGKYGALPDSPSTIADPGHTPTDPRKPPRTVDALEYKIKSNP